MWPSEVKPGERKAAGLLLPLSHLSVTKHIFLSKNIMACSLFCSASFSLKLWKEKEKQKGRRTKTEKQKQKGRNGKQKKQTTCLPAFHFGVVAGLLTHGDRITCRPSYMYGRLLFLPRIYTTFTFVYFGIPLHFHFTFPACVGGVACPFAFPHYLRSFTTALHSPITIP